MTTEWAKGQKAPTVKERTAAFLRAMKAVEAAFDERGLPHDRALRTQLGFAASRLAFCDSKPRPGVTIDLVCDYVRQSLVFAGKLLADPEACESTLQALRAAGNFVNAIKAIKAQEIP
ncbi:MAG: hypothetical protein Q8Q14_10000 [Gemmatimonadales bacterium]|nr:hypothetical protein [Gemmatimonadales bacterium]